MKLLITGVCGFVGSRMARRFSEVLPGVQIFGIDNLSRRGAETSIPGLERLGVQLVRGDVRMTSDFAQLPDADWVIDCAANPTVMAGVCGGVSPRQLVEHNLGGTLNVLEYCRERNAGLVLLSSSRVYSIEALCNGIQLQETETRYVPVDTPSQPKGFSPLGVSEDFPTDAPVSLYGATKLSSELLVLEYGATFGFPVWINRCGVIGGPGQFGRADQGILAFWVYSFLLERVLRYIGFGGSGKQVRDFVLAEDVADLVIRQMKSPDRDVRRMINVGGGNASSLSLYELTGICQDYFKTDLQVQSSDEERPYDIPYYVTDITRVSGIWDWTPSLDGVALARKVCAWAAENRDFVERVLN